MDTFQHNPPQKWIEFCLYMFKDKTSTHAYKHKPGPLLRIESLTIIQTNKMNIKSIVYIVQKSKQDFLLTNYAVHN